MVLVRSLYFSAVFALSGFASPIGLNAIGEVTGAHKRAIALTAAVAPEANITANSADPIHATAEDLKTGMAPIRLNRAADGLFYVRARVNGTPIRFVVDTGSSVMVLTRRDAAKVGIAPNAGDFDSSLQTAGGDSAMAWTTLDHVRMGGRHVGKLRAVVMRDGLEVSLLGQNMLSRLGSVTIQGDSLTLR